MPWLEEAYPDLVDRYAELYRTPYGPKAEREAISRQVHTLIDRTPRRAGALAPRFRRPPARTQRAADRAACALVSYPSARSRTARCALGDGFGRERHPRRVGARERDVAAARPRELVGPAGVLVGRVQRIPRVGVAVSPPVHRDRGDVARRGRIRRGRASSPARRARGTRSPRTSCRTGAAGPARFASRRGASSVRHGRDVHEVQHHRLVRRAREPVVADADRVVELQSREEPHRVRDLVHAAARPTAASGAPRPSCRTAAP